MTVKVPTEWNGAMVRSWLQRRVAAARSDQVEAQRAGWSRQDDCDRSTAEEMVCTLLLNNTSTEHQRAFGNDLRVLLDRDEYIWRGVYDDVRFDRHVRSYLRKLVKMTRANDGFERTGRYQ